MYFVIGNTPQRVSLKDLNDFVYYKQQKAFTDEQYSKSQDLQREIKKGTLTILRHTDENTGSFEVPTTAFSEIPKIPVADNAKLDALLDRIKSLEEVLVSKTSSEGSSNALGTIMQRLESELTGANNEKTLTILFNAIKKLEERIDQGVDTSILKRLEDLVNRAPERANSTTKVEEEERRPEEIYVPNITVEDANTHIKLNVRTIESSDNVTDSLKKLKELKSKST